MAEKSEADKRYEILAEFNLVPSAIFPLNNGVHCTVSSTDEAIGNRKLTSKVHFVQEGVNTVKNTKMRHFLVFFNTVNECAKNK